MIEPRGRRRARRRPTIFVAIPSYRDPECQWTVRDLFTRAAHPERVTVGVAWQILGGEDDPCFLVETRPDRVRTRIVDARRARGLGWARSLAHGLWAGEDFVLQADSHLRFHDSWDERLLTELGRCRSERAAVSAYPAAYEPPRAMRCFTTRIVLDARQPGGWLRPRGQLMQARRPERSAHFAGGFIFASASLFQEVPSDPEIDIEGEELCFSARAWTRGWDAFAPSACLVHHYYDRVAASVPEGPHVRGRGHRSLRRVRHLLGLEPTSDSRLAAALAPGRPFGLGTARSLEAWREAAGFMPRRASRAREGDAPPSRRPGRGDRGLGRMVGSRRRVAGDGQLRR